MKRRPQPKVLMLTAGGVIGGMERAIVNVVRQLIKRGWRVRTVFAPMPQSSALLAWCRDQGVEAETNEAMLVGWMTHRNRDFLALRRFVRQSNPDIVHLNYGVVWVALKDVLAVRSAGRLRCIVTVHGPDESWADIDRRKAILTRLAARFVDAIIVPSRASRAVMLAAGVPDSKVHVIPYGLSIPTYLPTRANARAHLGLPLDAFIIGSHARLVPHKGVADLIDAVAGMSDRGKETVLVIAGEGPERASLEQRAAERLPGRVILLGHLSETSDFYAALDVFALPSQKESFGIVYAEAAFHGVPSIGTNVGGIPDAIVDGETGLLVPPGDVEALAQAIAQLRDDLERRENMGEQARVRALAEFVEDRMAERYAKVYAAKG